MLPVGTQVVLPRHGGSWRVGVLLGEGGQGAVHQLDSLDGRPSLALKWYRPESAHPDQLTALARLAQLPAPSESFLWPLEVLDGPEGGFGYVMPLRPSSYLPIADLLTGRADASFSAVARLCMGLADSFLRLHAQGLCYRDISLGNVFFDPVDRPAAHLRQRQRRHRRTRAGARARHLALHGPRGGPRRGPAVDRDRPLLARRAALLPADVPPSVCKDVASWPTPASTERPRRSSSGPTRCSSSTPMTTPTRPTRPSTARSSSTGRSTRSYIHDDFVRAFTAGLAAPAQRVREGFWRAHLARLLDSVMICVCGRENLTDDGIPMGPCWSCKRDLPVPVRLTFGPRALVLNAGTRVTRHHLRRDYVYDDAVAEVVPHPARPDLWGLRNLTDITWTATGPDGDTQEVPPGRSLGLVLGTRIDFGPAVGKLAG